MTSLLHILILIPLLGFIISLVIPRRNETLLSYVSVLTIGFHLFAIVVFVLKWIFDGHPTLNIKDLALFKAPGYEFYIDFCFDKITAVYLFVGAFLTFMIMIYSRYYMHREGGYKRFFNTILFFYLGYIVTIFSGNLETLFIGWEILGICSFLLIAFYRDRYFPVKNAVKVFSIYRIGDVGLILAMWLSHHLWHENITFLKLNNYELVHEELQSHSLIGATISILLLITAAAKSAQLPFSSWLPRAMEGPTPSSAIFYGSLSVHIGVFLLLRTFPFWEQQTSIRILIGVLGFFTSLIATTTARVQSSVKSQIAYASIAQIGFIFIEVAAGFENLALLHFAGNAFLRTYQLLVSPSVVSYLIREQFYNFVPRNKNFENKIPKKIRYGLYMLSVKEWNLDAFINRIFFKPMKWIGKKLSFLTLRRVYFLVVPLYIAGIISLFTGHKISPLLHAFLPSVFAFIGLLLVIRSFIERSSVRNSWTLILMNHFWIMLAVSFNEQFNFNQIMLYASGIVVAGVIGYLLLNKLINAESNVNLDKFQGHVYEHPKLAFAFLLCCLGLTGFPITPTFIGEDVIFTHIHQNQVPLAFFCALSLILGGVSVIRIYAKLYLGPHIKTYHELPFRSS